MVARLGYCDKMSREREMRKKGGKKNKAEDRKIRQRTGKYTKAQRIHRRRENWDLMKNNDKVC